MAIDNLLDLIGDDKLKETFASLEPLSLLSNDDSGGGDETVDRR